MELQMPWATLWRREGRKGVQEEGDSKREGKRKGAAAATWRPPTPFQMLAEYAVWRQGTRDLKEDTFQC